ncbi:beta-ketoacyl synthase N-terminal-like domain-containing protein [Streptomyces fradiae]|uniref:beta-ketoacyl synthase N-terminal-like domain-containing protein n=1 Tax=Streptomyces fradiae TaxID=1906 RepID=UPI0029422F26|nr:beta-ketoacyl synthase N-terminal-like domain-containing protein [Streptomyces fradiae]WOI62197.1 beta-ketoacyl synthase N-terminal-like domain-containing protein [Streptomyces fradiae]
MHVREHTRARPSNDIAVTGLGLVTPAGRNAESTWDGLMDGFPTARRDPELAGLPVDFSCRAAGAGFEGATPLVLAAAREAVADAGLGSGSWDGTRIAVVLGSGGAAPGLGGAGREVCAQAVGADLGALGPGFVTSGGCGAGVTAIGVARELLRSGACDVVVAGGGDTLRGRTAAAGLGRAGALSSRTHDPAGASRPFDAERDGFVPGEGAGVLVLERVADARARRARLRAVLAGYGAAAEGCGALGAGPGGAGRVGVDARGRGVERAVLAAFADAGLGPEDVDHVNAHGSGGLGDDLAEARMLRRVFRGAPPPVTAVKGVLGHAGGGAGAVEAACAVLTLGHQAIPPTANLDRLDPEIELDVVVKSPRRRPVRAALSTSFGLGGQNTALLLRAV